MSKGKVVILTREMILEAQDLERELVEVPEWGGAVYVRALTGEERDAYEASLINERTIQRGRKVEVTRETNLRNIRARLAALTMVDVEGNRLFNDNQVHELGKKSAAALERVVEVAQRLSGLSDEDMEELAKNSEGDPSDDSTSD